MYYVYEHNMCNSVGKERKKEKGIMHGAVESAKTSERSPSNTTCSPIKTHGKGG